MSLEVKVLNSKIRVSLVIVLTYCTLRYFVYGQFPAADLAEWIQRDWIMNLPRLFCLGLVLILGFSSFDERKDLLPNGNKLGLVAVITVLSFGPVFLRPFYIQYQSYSFESLWMIGIGSVAVGFFEEALFRGSLLDSLKKRFGSNTAIFGSSIIFTLFHIQAQRLADFPTIFFWGLLFATLRLDGVSLFWLSVMHAIYDFSILLWIPSEELRTTWRLIDIAAVSILFFGFTTWQKIVRKELKRSDIIRIIFLILTVVAVAVGIWAKKKYFPSKLYYPTIAGSQE